MAASQVNIVQPFERLRTNNQILGGYNFVGRDTNFVGDTHGTYVLSTMGGIKMRSWSVLRLTHRIIYLLPKTLVVKPGRRILMGGSSRRGRSPRG
jgi:hypothetical protein